MAYMKFSSSTNYTFMAGGVAGVQRGIPNIAVKNSGDKNEKIRN